MLSKSNSDAVYSVCGHFSPKIRECQHKKRAPGQGWLVDGAFPLKAWSVHGADGFGGNRCAASSRLGSGAARQQPTYDL